MSSPQPEIKMIRMMLDRMERIPPDSPWAHRASGVRGALMKLTEQMEMRGSIDPAVLNSNLIIGFQILKEVAKARSRRSLRFYERIKR
jgi:hypothetical protein